MNFKELEKAIENLDYCKPVVRVGSDTIGYEVPGGILYVTNLFGANSRATHSTFVPSSTIINRSET